MLIWNTVCRVKVRRKRCVEQRSKTNGALCRVRKIKALRALRCFRHPLFDCSFVRSSFVGFAVLGIWRVLGLARGERFL